MTGPASFRFTETVPAPHQLRRAALGAVAATVATTAAVATAAVGSAWATFALLCIAVCVDRGVVARHPFATWVLRRIGAGPAARTAVAAVVVTLAAGRTASSSVTIGAAVVGLLAVAMAVVTTAANEAAARERRAPLLTRNVELGLQLPRPSRRVVVTTVASAAMPLAALAVAVAPRAGAVAALLTGATVAAATELVAAVATAMRLRGRRARVLVSDAARDALTRLQPQVLLYFAGAPEEVYQADMWLGPLERADVGAVVLVRDPEALHRLGPTSLPVFCAEHNGTVASLPLTERVVTLFATHSGNNLAILRRDEVHSVFVGHGDSDKPDSSNPYARVYDEIWVAGPAARERYLAADIGVRPETVIEVGRPQLPTQWPAPIAPLTVLYAPTWEGWGDDPHHSSLPHVGVAVVEALVAAGVRVVYRAHPLTGVRNVAVRHAHAAVLATLTRNGAARLTRDGDPAQAVTHLVVGADVALYDTFALAHALVADVSSVVSDWLGTGRPYAMLDTRGVGVDEFRRCYPSAGGATVLPPDLAGLDRVVAAASGAGDDGLADARRVTRDALLGPADAPAAFQRALRSALARPPRRRAGVAAP